MPLLLSLVLISCGSLSSHQKETGAKAVPSSIPSSSISIESGSISLDPDSALAQESVDLPTEIVLDLSEGDSEDDAPAGGSEFQIVRNESVEGYIEFFNTSMRDRFKLWLERSGRYIPLMQAIFKEYGLPEDLVFVALIESGFNPYAYSRAKAVGPWQFIKSTGKIYRLRIDSWVDERRDPIKSTHAAARYLKNLHARFGSWPLAMAGYNAGEGKIERAIAKTKSSDFWDLRNSRTIRPETKGYVPKFMAATIIAKNPERYGFTLDYHEPLQFETVTIPGSSNLRVVAEAAGIAYDDLKLLNPELKTELTPPYANEYALRLPSGTADSFMEAYSKIPDERKTIGTRYVIRRNDTLSAIAARFGTTIPLLREINKIQPKQMLRVGQTIFIPKLNAKRDDSIRKVASASSPKVRAAAAKRSPIQMTALESQSTALSAHEGEKILYQVKDGDTLWDISRSFNISLTDLKRFNGLGKRSIIRPGDQLVLGYQSKDL